MSCDPSLEHCFSARHQLHKSRRTKRDRGSDRGLIESMSKGGQHLELAWRMRGLALVDVPRLRAAFHSWQPQGPHTQQQSHEPHGGTPAGHGAWQTHTAPQAQGAWQQPQGAWQPQGAPSRPHGAWQQPQVAHQVPHDASQQTPPADQDMQGEHGAHRDEEPSKEARDVQDKGDATEVRFSWRLSA